MGLYVVLYAYSAHLAEARQRVRPDHAAYLADLERRGLLVLSGPYADGTGALLLVRADGEEDCCTELNADPFWTAGLVDGREIRRFKVGFGLPDETDRVVRPG